MFQDIVVVARDDVVAGVFQFFKTLIVLDDIGIHVTSQFWLMLPLFIFRNEITGQRTLPFFGIYKNTLRTGCVSTYKQNRKSVSNLFIPI